MHSDSGFIKAFKHGMVDLIENMVYGKISAHLDYVNDSNYTGVTNKEGRITYLSMADITGSEKSEESVYYHNYENFNISDFYSENYTYIPAEKQKDIDVPAMTEGEIIKNFYVVDRSTGLKDGQINAEEFLKEDFSIKPNLNEPQILIYHTHGHEGFADSIEGDYNTTVVGVGEYLANILEKQYGYGVLHDTGIYDGTRDEAYSKALPNIEKILEDNPSIEIVIDLHRDEVNGDSKLLTQINGKDTAKIMFFNGLSYLKDSGDITYLQNDNLHENLAFSFQAQLAAMEYYPDFTRKIYLKAYRYNMHLKGRSMLVELGAQNNTLEEAMNACEPLAHIIDIVLSGKI